MFSHEETDFRKVGSILRGEYPRLAIGVTLIKFGRSNMFTGFYHAILHPRRLVRVYTSMKHSGTGDLGVEIWRRVQASRVHAEGEFPLFFKAVILRKIVDARRDSSFGHTNIEPLAEPVALLLK